MSDFQHAVNMTPPVITPGSGNAMGLEMLNMGQSIGNTSNAWPAANRAVFYPFRIAIPTKVTNFFWLNGSVVATNNIDMGIYDSQGNRITSLGSTATSGASALQSASITPVILEYGLYYLAIAHDGTTNVFSGATQTTPLPRFFGIYRVNTAFPLPTTVAYAVPAANEVVLQYSGLTTQGVI